MRPQCYPWLQGKPELPARKSGSASANPEEDLLAYFQPLFRCSRRGKCKAAKKKPSAALKQSAREWRGKSKSGGRAALAAGRPPVSAARGGCGVHVKRAKGMFHPGSGHFLVQSGFQKLFSGLQVRLAGKGSGRRHLEVARLPVPLWGSSKDQNGPEMEIIQKKPKKISMA
jgi:hypothetical protein